MTITLTTAPILAHPNNQKLFLLFSDASAVGLGNMSSQLDGDQHKHPIIFFSRSLSPVEQIYTATESECLGIVWASKKLNPYLDGY
jgi:hypothetical protein